MICRGARGRVGGAALSSGRTPRLVRLQCRVPGCARAAGGRRRAWQLRVQCMAGTAVTSRAAQGIAGELQGEQGRVCLAGRAAAKGAHKATRRCSGPCIPVRAAGQTEHISLYVATEQHSSPGTPPAARASRWRGRPSQWPPVPPIPPPTLQEGHGNQRVSHVDPDQQLQQSVGHQGSLLTRPAW